MTNQEAQVVAQRSLTALNDQRVMVPCESVEPLADLKIILRSLLNGSVILVDAPKAADAGAPE